MTRLSNHPLITITVLGICIAVAIISSLGNQIDALHGLFYSQYSYPKFYEIRQGQLWRAVTPIFIHFGIVHLLMNGIMMWVFGRLMEPIHGRAIFALVIIIIAIISNTAQYMVSEQLFGGLSGVLYGLLGFIWGMGYFTSDYPLKLDRKFIIIILGWFVLCWSDLLSNFGLYIANTAHTAGLISGIALAYLLAKLSYASYY